MPKQNPNATQVQELTPELLGKLESGDVKMLDLHPETFKKVEEYLDNPDSTKLSSESETKLEDKASEAPVVKAEEKKDTTVPTDYVPGPKYKQKADEANANKIALENAQKRIRQLEALAAPPEKTEVKVPTSGEVWDDAHQIKVAKDLAELRLEVADLKKNKAADNESTLAKLRQERDEMDFRQLANDFEEFKSDETLEGMEKRYSGFYFGTGATLEDSSPVSRYFNDAAFRVAMEAAGVKAPKDFDKINTILQARALRDKLQKEDPETTLSDAMAVRLRRDNKLKDMLVAERLKGAAGVADKIHNNANETITVQPSGGVGNDSQGLNEATAMEWMKKNPHPRTAAEREMFKRVEAFIDGLPV